MKNMQFGPYLWPNRQNSCILQEIGVGEDDGYVRFLTGSRNIGISRMRNEKIFKLALIYGRIAKIPAFYSKLGSANMMMTSDF